MRKTQMTGRCSTPRDGGLRSLRRGLLVCAVSFAALAAGVGGPQGLSRVAQAADVSPSVYAPISPQRMSDAMKVL
ncbi:hypothetical protein AD930_00200, partial [Acetobacter malorum]